MDRQEEILSFWFGEIDPEGRVSDEVAKKWWEKNSDFDTTIKEKFEKDIFETAAGKRDDWSLIPRGRLALIITLDQFSRNVFRDTPDAFTSDDKALRFALEGIETEQDKELQFIERVFFYMPLEHSENKKIQRACVEKFHELLEEVPAHLKEAYDFFLGFAKRHCEIIERFDRFPHRNGILNRESTPEELAFLEQPNSSF